MNDNSLTDTMLRDTRYEGIIHMVTAANGAPDHYDFSESNEARYENAAEAIEKDNHLKEVYAGHKNRYIIDNKFPNFKAKIDVALEYVCHILQIKGREDFF